MKLSILYDEFVIARFCRGLAHVVTLAFALVLLSAPNGLHAATPAQGDFYYSTFGASNEVGSGSFSWDGATLSLFTHQIVALPGLGIDASLVVGSDGNIYSGRAGGVYQINPATKEFQSVSSGVNNNVTSIDPTKTTLYVGWKDTPLATVPTGANFGPGTPHAISGDDTVASGLAFLPDGSVWYTTGGEDRLGNVGTIDLATYVTTRKLTNVSATAITYDSFTGDIFTAGIDGIAQIDPVTGTVVSTWTNPQGQGLFIGNLAATGAGHLLAFDSSNLLRIWDFSSGSKLIGGAGTVIASAPTTVTSGGLYLAKVVAPHLLNISTRLNVGTSDNVLIGGIIITGADTKQVVLRAIGPSLGVFGVTGVLADPTLDLYDGSGMLIASNDNWMDNSAQDQMTLTDNNLAPTDDAESALVANLEPGAYTAIVRGAGDTTGVALVEAYDLDNGATDSNFANISTRGFVETGDNVMIGGFILGGGSGGVAQVIVRGIGPSLAAFGVTNPLADPSISLFDGEGNLIASNDNWMDDPNMQMVSDDGLAPGDPNESALYEMLPSGAYTVVLSGVGDTIGVGLIESYDVDSAAGAAR